MDFERAVDMLAGVRVFVTSREKIKHPEGTDLFDEAIRVLREELNHRHSGGDGEGVFWHPGTQRPEPMTCDETGCTTGLVLVIHSPDDGGPNVRQGRYDHCLRGFFDSTTSQRIDPDQWAFAPKETA